MCQLSGELGKCDQALVMWYLHIRKYFFIITSVTLNNSTSAGFTAEILQHAISYLKPFLWTFYW